MSRSIKQVNPPNISATERKGHWTGHELYRAILLTSFPPIDNTIYEMYERLTGDIPGLWRMVELSNAGFYLKPEKEEITLITAFLYCPQVSSATAGILASYCAFTLRRSFVGKHRLDEYIDQMYAVERDVLRKLIATCTGDQR